MSPGCKAKILSLGSSGEGVVGTLHGVAHGWQCKRMALELSLNDLQASRALAVTSHTGRDIPESLSVQIASMQFRGLGSETDSA